MDDFHCLEVAFSSPAGASSTHTIYCKAHRVRMNSDLTPNDRTLFTLGWPPYCSEVVIKELFSRAGHVSEVFLQASPGAVENSRAVTSLLQGHLRGFQVMHIRIEYDMHITDTNKSRAHCNYIHVGWLCCNVLCGRSMCSS